MREATLISHLGLGDLILISGAAVYISQSYDRLNFPCRANQETSVRSFFSLQPKISVYVVEEVNGMCPFQAKHLRGDIISPGLFSPAPRDPDLSFAENYYAGLGIPYSARWDYCPIQEACKEVRQLPQQYFDYAFIHDDHSRGLDIREEYPRKDLPVIRPDPCSSNILSYANLISRAKEGHFIDSSFKHITESIQTDGDLYYHEYARSYPDPDVPTRKKWVTIK
jgi:hypothetical protein